MGVTGKFVESAILVLRSEQRVGLENDRRVARAFTSINRGQTGRFLIFL